MATQRLDALVQTLNQNPQATDAIGPLSTGERIYVAMSANRYDLLPASYQDPIEAFNRLDHDLQLYVCQWRGWPLAYARG